MITVKNIMTKNVITITEGAKISEASKLMIKKDVWSLIVTKDRSPIAIITKNDIIKEAILKKKNFSSVKVKDIMNKKFIPVGLDSKYSVVMKYLKKKKIKKFPVVNSNNKLVGLVTESDLVQATMDFTRMHQITQEIILAIFGLATAFFLFYFSPFWAAIFR